MGRFDGRVAVVTGAASGIGRAVALRLASEGAAVACLDVAADGAGETAAAARAGGREARAYGCDVSDAAAVVAAFGQAEADLGSPDVACNAAGIGSFSHSEESTVEEFDRIIGVNLRGTYLVCREFLARHGTAAAAAARDAGAPKPSIVNIASTAGLMGHPYGAAYSASKGGVVMLTRTFAVEFAERGVRVNAVAPGGVDTPLIASFRLPDDASRRLIGRMIPPMGMAKPEQIAAVVAFVASEEAAAMSGAIVPADGSTIA
jgi:NAD(P)-dependent dehydrogenase (short-subunit alcohol dehydrogenase family)